MSFNASPIYSQNIAYLFVEREGVEISMDIEKAINSLQCENDLMLFDATTGETDEYWNLKGLDKEWYDTHKFCIKALEELEQYRQIGTVDECRVARDRQVTKEP